MEQQRLISSYTTNLIKIARTKLPNPLTWDDEVIRVPLKVDDYMVEPIPSHPYPISNESEPPSSFYQSIMYFEFTKDIITRDWELSDFHLQST